MKSIKDQVAVITGAAGGIGQALAIEMARRGAACIALIDSVSKFCKWQAKQIMGLAA
jgi:short chain dehydrogenase